MMSTDSPCSMAHNARDFFNIFVSYMTSEDSLFLPFFSSLLFLKLE